MARLINLLEAQRNDLETEERNLVAAAEERGSLTDEERARLTELAEHIQHVEGDISAENARINRGRTEAATPAGRDAEPGPLTDLGAYGAQPRSFGQLFAEADGWTEYKARVAPHGFNQDMRIESPKIEVPASFLPRKGAIVTSGGTSGGALSVPDQSGIFDPGTFQRELTIRDIITTGTTDSDIVEYVRMASLTNNAAPVAEADSVDAADLTGHKAWSDLTLQRVAEMVKTLAHAVAATSRTLSDNGQLRTIVDSVLRSGLAEVLEEQIVSGDGTGENFRGILDYVGDATTPLTEQAWDTDILTTTRKARTKVRTVGRGRPTFYLFNPEDWERIDLEMTMGGGGSNYRQAGELTAPRLWGVPVVESEAVPAGTGIVGDGRMAVLWDRQQTTIQASSGYMNFFMKNMVAILAELRAAFGVIRPQAFVAIDLTAL